jgi:hypothetical protein
MRTMPRRHAKLFRCFMKEKLTGIIIVASWRPGAGVPRAEGGPDALLFRALSPAAIPARMDAKSFDAEPSSRTNTATGHALARLKAWAASECDPLASWPTGHVDALGNL